jgi:[pyruvate, water dikinase]-phosphate phosphotransferase / [pyruvate, water dikinase] kinase
MREEHNIVIVSDGTGRTARRLMDAVLVQYAQSDLQFSLVQTYQQVLSKRMLSKILREIDNEYLVLFSIISRELNEYFHRQLLNRGILHLNVLEPMLGTLSKFLGVHPDYQPGLLHVIDDRYYKKIDAIGYTVEHDDGRGSLIEEADVVLLGLSRTCKTPISMYLACNHGLKVANIPVVRDAVITQNLLARLEAVPLKKIIGLLMQPEVLAHVREERSQLLATGIKSQAELQQYHDIREIGQEFRFCRELFTVRKWQTIDVTRRAIEEVSLEILEKLHLED